jgi:hypothetical protein
LRLEQGGNSRSGARPAGRHSSAGFGKGARRRFDLPVSRSMNLPWRGINLSGHLPFCVYNGGMPDDQTVPRTITPLFSIIIPLEYHRGQWDRAWQGWQSQTLDRASFEIILVVPPDFPDRNKLGGTRRPGPPRAFASFA